MENDISLTIRLPHELNIQLKTAAKTTGFTKTNLIRMAIHDFLTVADTKLDFSPNPDKKDRLVLNVNPYLHGILENACKKYGQSMNAVVTAVSILALERASKWMK